MTDPLRRFSPWFYAAAVYNLAWGSMNVVAPTVLTGALGLRAQQLVAWRVVGLLVLVYAPGFWWAARRPSRQPHLIAIACLGKLLGPVGFAWAAATGALPLTFGLTIVTNDLIWLPAFGLYLRAAARPYGGLRALLSGAEETNEDRPERPLQATAARFGSGPRGMTIPTGAQGGPASPGSARVLEIESTVFARLSEALAPAYLGQAKVKLIVGNKVIFLDALFRSLTGQHSDVIVELKYLSRSSGVRMRVSETVSEVVRACTTYKAITGRPALGLVVVVLAAGVPNAPGATSVEERFRDDAASRVMQPSLVVLREEELGSLQPEQLRERLPVDVQRGRTL